MVVRLNILKMDERAITPKYAHAGDACADLAVLIDDSSMCPFNINDDLGSKTPVEVVNAAIPYVVLEPGESAVFHTGIKMSTQAGWAVKIHVRSSTGIKKDLELCNTTGIIDTCTYRGEVLVAIRNAGKKPRKIYSGDRLAQIEVFKVHNVEIVEVSTLSATLRGTGGIGSTGN